MAKFDFSKVTGLKTPRGNVTKISVGGKVIWENTLFRYVSLGDSIAAGHTIDENWAKNYGEASQYGKGSNTQTALVPGCYTDRIYRYLQSVYGRVDCKSFARSGAKIEYRERTETEDPTKDSRSLIYRLDDKLVKNAISRANLVTVCIGANDLLEEAMYALGDYINAGDLTAFEATVSKNLKILSGEDTSGTSYIDLFEKLNGINPNATYVFTTVYNPYKYLHIARGTEENEYGDGFFGPIFEHFPQITTLGFEWDKKAKEKIVESEAVSTVFGRVNGLAQPVEKYVNDLNNVIKSSIEKYRTEYNHPNFLVADTKALFDSIPNRGKPYPDNLHYNDLVSVEFTEGFNVSKANWGELWNGNVINGTVCNTAAEFWDALLKKYDCLYPFDTKVGDWKNLASELMTKTVLKVIVPDVDPHPEYEGHYLLYRSFADALGEGYERLNTITYNANGGIGEAYAQKVIDKALGRSNSETTVYSILTPNRFTPPIGHHIEKWKNSGGNIYNDGEAVYVGSNITLYAQWEKSKYKLTVIQRNRRGGSDVVNANKVDKENFAYRMLLINGVGIGLNETLVYNNGEAGTTEEIYVEYGSPVEVWAKSKYGNNGIISQEAQCMLWVNDKATYASEIYHHFFMPNKEATIVFDFCSDNQDFGLYKKVWWDIYVFNK